MTRPEAPGGATAHAWRDLTPDHPLPLVERRRVHGERMTVARIELKRGFRIDTHAHDEEQITVVESGRLRFRLGAGEAESIRVVAAGELLVLPPGTPHGAEAIEDTVVLDLYSPPARETGLDRAASD